MDTVSTESNVQPRFAEGQCSDLVVSDASTMQGSARSRLRRAFLHPSLAMNAASNWAATAVNMAVGFFLTPFIIYHIGKAGFGIWTLVGSVVGYYGVLGLGVTNAITPYTARYIGQKDWQALDKFVSTALTFFLSVGVTALIASFVLAGPLASFFNISADGFASFQHTLWLVGIAAAVGFPGKVFISVVRGHENYVAGNCIVIAAALLRAGLTVWLLFQGFGLLGAALAVAVSETFSLGAIAILCRTLVKRVRVRLFSGSRQMLRILLLYGSTAFVIAICGVLRFQIDSAVIGKVLGMEAVAVYAIAAVLMRYYRRGIRDGLKALKPRFATLYGSGQKEKLQQTLFRATTVASAFAFGGAALLIVFGRNLIHLWVGTKFTDAAPVLYVLVAGLAFEMAQNPGINVLFAMDRIRLLAGFSMAEALLNVSLSLLLVGPLGIIGIALGTAIPCIIFKLLLLPYLVTRAASVSITKYYVRILSPALIGSAVVLLAALFGGL